MRQFLKSEHNLENKKKKIVRIVLFALALVIAVYAFTSGVMALTHRESGYYGVEFTAEGKAVLYRSGLHMTYYADGSSNEIRQRINEVQKQYTSFALDAFRRFDAEQTYEGYTNIASLNAAPNTEIKVDQTLFDTLERAYRLQSDTYSIFAGALHGQWETLRYLDEPEDFDPLSDPDKRALLEKLAEWINTPGTFDLSFDSEKTTVKLTVSEEYLAWAAENEIDRSVLDLNVLHDAFLLESVSQALREKGYTDGFLYTDTGLYVYMRGAAKDISFTLTGLDGQTEVTVATLNAQSPACFVRFTAFAPDGAGYGYYAVERDGRRVFRHLYPDIADGKYRNQLMTLFLLGGEDSIVDLTCAAASLNGKASPEEIKTCAAALPKSSFAAYTLQGDAAKPLYIRNGSSRKGFAPVAESGFGVVDIQANASPS